MNTIACLGPIRHSPARAPTRMPAMLAAGLALMIGLLGQSLTTAPTAAALTQDEALYISLLADDGITPAPGYTYNDFIFTGHQIAYDLRKGINPGAVAYVVWVDNPSLTKDGAASVVAAAMVAFAPELVPVYLDQSPPGDTLT